VIKVIGAPTSPSAATSFLAVSASGSDPLTGAPAPVDDEQLREVALKVIAAPARAL
jgi:hypothetical protein